MAEAASLKEELALVNASRKSALQMLGRAVTLTRAAQPLLDKAAKQLEAMGSSEDPLELPMVMGLTHKLLRLTKEAVDLGEQSMRLRRKLADAPDQVVELRDGGEMTEEEADAALAAFAPVVSRAAGIPALRLIEGGGEQIT
jgi:hypothetical protein